MRARLTWSLGLPVCLLAAAASLVACVAGRQLVGDTSDASASATGGRGPAGQTGTGGANVIATGGIGHPTGGTGGGAASGGRGGRDAGTGATGGIARDPGAAGLSGVAGGAGAGTGGSGASVTPRRLPRGARSAVTAVSRFLWQSAPDASLLAMADSGAVVTSEDLRKLTLRMLIDARAHTGVGDFYRWWLTLDRVAALATAEPKDPMTFPELDAVLAGAMANETQTFGAHVTLDGDGLFSTLLTAPFTFVNQALAGVYKLEGITGTALRRVALDPTERAGIFTQPGLLAMGARATQNSPVLRGIFLNRQLLCRDLPPPPANVPPLPTPPPGLTLRQLLTFEESSDPSCVMCHGMVNPIGFAFERYDPIGRFRTADIGLPIDSSGQISLTNGPITFDDAPQLVAALAKTPEAQVCMSQRWLEYAIGRSLTDQESATVADAHRWFSASGFNLRELIAGVTQTDLFLTHTPACTPGADQTCNDVLSVSSLRGHCTEGLRCVCASTWDLNPQTGRCY